MERKPTLPESATYDALTDAVLAVTAQKPDWGRRTVSRWLRHEGNAQATEYRVRRVMAYLAVYRIA